MVLASVRRRTDKVFFGWWIVAASCVVNAVGGGVYWYGFAVFFLPIKAALGLSSASTSLIFSLSRAEGAIEGPVAGYLIDRFGARKILTVGAIVVGIGYVLLSQVNSYLWFLIIYLGIISLAFNGSFSTSTMSVVNNWFIKRKGLALAISIAAHSLGGAILSPILAFTIYHMGWRITIALSGILLVAFVVPFAQLLRPSPEAMGLLPDGDNEEQGSIEISTSKAKVNESAEFTVRQALRTNTYWMLALGTMLRTGTLGTLIVHFIPIMVWKGNSEQGAAVMLGVMAFLSIPMRITIGWLGDRWSRSRMLSAGMVLGALSLLVLQSASSLWHIWIFICVFSVVEGLSALNWALVGDYFGRRRFATLRGILSLIYSWGMIVMPLVAGRIYDQTESYRMSIWIFVGMYVVGAILFLFLRRPRLPVEVNEQTVT
jgi:MFS family permease